MMDAAPPTLESNVDDDWVKLAMKDDVAVVRILLNIKHADPPPLPCYSASPSFLKLEWSVRQRRSKHVPRKLSHVDKKRAEESNRGSPTTPLSWSGGGGVTSVSGGEESKPRSNKVAVASCATISKRSRKRKTLVQLRDEECLLLKERYNLKKEIRILRLNVEKQRARNESLRKLQQTMIKVASSSASDEGIWYQPEQVNAVGEISRVMDLGNSGMVHEVVNCREAAFPLPDLNLPFEETQNPEAFYEIC